MAIRGITIYGAKALVSCEDEAAVSSSPVYLPADLIDDAIRNGSLEAGAFKNAEVFPPVSEWPERWKFLRE